MNIHFIVLPTISVFILSLGFLAYVRNKTSLTHISFFFLSFFLACWITVGGYMTNLFPPFISNITFWSRITFTFGGLMGLSFTYFIFVFPKRSKKLSWIEKLWLLVGALLVVLIPSTDFIVRRAFVTSRGIAVVSGPLSILFSLWAMISIIIVLYILIARYRRSKGIIKTQIKYVFLGIFIFGGTNLVTNLFIQQFFMSSAFLNYGLYASVFFAGSIAYAIIKLRLMDIRFLLLRSVAYSLTAGLIITGYVAAAYFVFLRYKGFANQNVLNIFTLLILIALYNPLRRFIEKNTDKLFYKGRYNFDDLLKEINDIAIRNPRSVFEITTKTMKALVEQMRLRNAAFVLVSSPRIDLIVPMGFEEKVSFWKEPVELTLGAEGILVYDELEDEDKTKTLLREKGISLLVPIRTEERFEAVLALGEKRSGDMYTSGDLKLIELSSPQIALALENARLYEHQKETARLNRALADTDTVIHSTLNLRQILARVLEEALKAIGCESAGIVLQMDEYWAQLEILRGLPRKLSGEQLTNEQKAIVAIADITKNQVIINDTSTGREIERLLGEKYGLKSIMVFPLFIKDNLAGAVYFSYQSRTVSFTGNQIDFASKLSYSLSLAYENALLFKETMKAKEADQRRVRKIEAIAIFGSLITATLTLQETRELISEYSQILSQGDFSVYLEKNEKEATFSIKSGENVPTGVSKYGVPAKLVEKVGFEDQRALSVKTDGIPDKFFKMLAKEGYEQVIILPLEINKISRALIIMGKKPSLKLTGEDLVSYNLFATQAKVALRNAKMLRY